MVFIKGDPAPEAGQLPPTKVVEDMQRFNEELVNAGVMLAGDGLYPSSKGVRVRFEAGKRTVIDGPFADAKELVAGYWLWQVRSLDEAIEWLKKAPFDGGTEVEIRPIFESEDFVEGLGEEVRAREGRLREAVANRPS